MSVIREDSHGLYVKVGGYLFRPQCNYRYLVVGLGHAKGDFKKGDKVKAHHISQTMFGKVGDERWFSHGQYFDGFTQTHKNSEDLFKDIADYESN